MIKIRHACNNDATKIFYLKNVNNQSILIFFERNIFWTFQNCVKQLLFWLEWKIMLRRSQNILDFFLCQTNRTGVFAILWRAEFSHFVRNWSFFQFLGHKFVISEPIFKICIRKIFALRSCIQIKYRVLYYYYANVISWTFSDRSSCWPCQCVSPTYFFFAGHFFKI